LVEEHDDAPWRKNVIDATTPVPPDKRGNYDQQLDDRSETDRRQMKLAKMISQKNPGERNNGRLQTDLPTLRG
jgi:hypothetical protein